MWKASEPQSEQHVESMESPTLPVEQTLPKPADDNTTMDKKQALTRNNLNFASSMVRDQKIYVPSAQSCQDQSHTGPESCGG
jgi:hypothetical protein